MLCSVTCECIVDYYYVMKYFPWDFADNYRLLLTASCVELLDIEQLNARKIAKNIQYRPICITYQK